jgi:ribonuclease MRP protein subunit RMP1
VLADADFDLHRTFTTLVADNQYAPLGLMLLATLARVRKLILPLRGDTEDNEAEGIQAALEGIEKSGLDLGEVIKRDEIFKSQEDEEKPQAGSEVKKPKDKKRERKGDEDEARLKAPADSTPTKRPKKKRKKGDAFDDIFDSLI